MDIVNELIQLGHTACLLVACLWALYSVWKLMLAFEEAYFEYHDEVDGKEG